MDKTPAEYLLTYFPAKKITAEASASWASAMLFTEDHLGSKYAKVKALERQIDKINADIKMLEICHQNLSILFTTSQRPLSEMLVSARTALGLTVEQVSEQVGIPAEFLRGLEEDANYLARVCFSFTQDLSWFMKLADTLEVPVADLLYTAFPRLRYLEAKWAAEE